MKTSFASDPSKPSGSRFRPIFTANQPVATTLAQSEPKRKKKNLRKKPSPTSITGKGATSKVKKKSNSFSAGGKVEGIEPLGDPTSEELIGANTTQAVVDHSAAENVVTLYVAPSQDGTVQTGSGNAVNIGMTVVDETGTQITLLDAAAIDEMGYEMEGAVTMEEGREETTSSSAVASAQNIQGGQPAQPSSETPPIVPPPVSNAKTESGVSQASPRATTNTSAKDPVPTGGGEGTAGQPSKKSKAQRD